MGFDCHATALAAAGVLPEAEESLDGVNLLPWLTGEKKGRPHEALFWRFQNQYAVRLGDWKLVKTAGQSPALFDLANDIGESNDVSESSRIDTDGNGYATLEELRVCLRNGTLGEFECNATRVHNDATILASAIRTSDRRS